MKALIFPSESTSVQFIPFLVNINDEFILRATRTNLLAENSLSSTTDEENDEIFTKEMEEYEVFKHQTILDHLEFRSILNRYQDNSMSFIAEDYVLNAEDFEHDIYLKISVTIFQ